jgi:hypothetical protein
MSDLLESATLGWAAGIIDGEGSIGVYYNSKANGFYLMLTAFNTDPRMCIKLQELFGGNVKYHKHDKPNAKGCFTWVLVAGNAATVLEILLPFLIIKKEQAELAIEFGKLSRIHVGRGCPVPESVLAARSEIARKLKQIKTAEFNEDFSPLTVKDEQFQ